MTAPASPAFARALVGLLEAGGVGRAVVSPGARSGPLARAIATSGIEAEVAIDERAAGFLALGMARGSGAPTLLACTSGSAGAHYLPALVEASYGRSPLVVVTADRPAELQDVGARQTIAQAGLFSAAVKRAFDLEASAAPARLSHLRMIVAQALDAARAAPAGPVHINVGFPEPLFAPAEGAGGGPAFEPPRPVRIERASPRADDAAAAALADRLARAERGALVLGPRPWERAPAALAASALALAENLGWPVIAEPAAHLRFGAGERDELVTAAGAIVQDTSLAERLAPDIILRAGLAPTSSALCEWLGARGADRTVLVDEAGLPCDPTLSADTILAAEPCEVFEDLRARLGDRRGRGGWLKIWREAERAARAELDGAARDGFWEGAIARAAAAAVPGGSAIAIGNSLPIRDLDAFAPATARAVWIYSHRGASGIDGGAAAALGAAVATGRPTLAILGDLAALHDAGGILAARAIRAPVAVLVVDNGGGGIFRTLPGSGDSAGTEYFLTPREIDLAALARAAGAELYTPREPAELELAIRSALERGEPALIRAAVDGAKSADRRARAIEGAARAAAAAAASIAPSALD